MNEPKRTILRNTEPSPAAQAAFAKHIEERNAYTAALPGIRKEGEAALRRLLPIAQGHSGQCRDVAAFLLGLYNGQRFPFNLIDLRGLDLAIHNDCMAVLRMDHSPAQEVHKYFPDGGRLFEELAAQWGFIKD